MIEAFQGLVFDMDGVLVDTSPCHAKAYEQMWNQIGLVAPDYTELAGRSTREVVQEYCSHLPSDQQRHWVRFKQQQALALLQIEDIVFSDTVQVLKKLRDQGLPLAVATSASEAGARTALGRLQMQGVFNAVITADQVTHAKPHPEVFIKAIESIRLDSQTVVVIEDSRAGIEGALASGARVANVRHQVEDIRHDRFLGYFPDLDSLYRHLFNQPS